MKRLKDEINKLNLMDNLKSSLKQDYIKSLKDDDFKEVVENLPLTEDILMKYTTKLQECSIEYGHCKDCKGLVECQNEVSGYVFKPEVDDNRLTFSYNPCRYKKDFLKKHKYQNNMYFFDEPKEIKEARMKDIYTDEEEREQVILWLDSFLDKYESDKNQKGLYLYGNFGCGKTYLISAMFNELAKKNVRVAIIYWPEFLRLLKASFDNDSSTDDQYTYIKKIPLLLIDDLGAENSTPWARDEILGPLLQYRMQEKLPTFFTSNLSLEELESHFCGSNYKAEPVKAKRIIERIKQLSSEMKMISKNNRK